MLFCSAPYGMFVAFNYKEYGQTAIFNDQLLSLFGSLGSVANGFFRAFWGILLDRFAFSRLSTIISCLLLVSCATIRFAVLSESTFAIAVICTYACYGGLFSLYPTQTVRILGK